MGNNKNNFKLLKVENLEVAFKTKRGEISVVENINFEVDEKKTLGIVGESGSGKSITALSVIKLLPERISVLRKGSIIFKGVDITNYSEACMESIRGKEISMIFQDPLTSLCPTLKIKTQIIECLLLDKKMSGRDANNYAVDLLKRVGIPDAGRRINNYPFQFSGGMQQRVMIAIAISRNPSLLIADEPTTALDVSVQNQILNLLIDLKNKFKMGLIIITHDMGVITRMCDKVLVMYAGKVMETGSIYDILHKPRHPYTAALLKSIPRIKQKRRKKLTSIEGNPPEIENVPKGCRFSPRCFNKKEICLVQEPRLEKIGEEHIFYCWNPIKVQV